MLEMLLPNAVSEAQAPSHPLAAYVPETADTGSYSVEHQVFFQALPVCSHQSDLTAKWSAGLERAESSPAGAAGQIPPVTELVLDWVRRWNSGQNHCALHRGVLPETFWPRFFASDALRWLR